VPLNLSRLLRCLLRARTADVPSLPRKRRFGWYPTNVRMAFLTLQFIAEPKIGHTIEKHFVEHDEAEDEGSGDPEGDLAHLHRQVRKIRRGLPVDRITIRLPRRPQSRP
jgi:hypothetical protein